MDLELNVGYGLTEAGPVVALGQARACPHGSVGRPLLGVEVQIDSGGEIIVRSPAVMRGYVDDEDATKDVLRDGWLRTGDRGKLDDDGFLFVTGRRNALWLTGGRSRGLVLGFEPESAGRVRGGARKRTIH